jgi:hypothetical protein
MSLNQIPQKKYASLMPLNQRSTAEFRLSQNNRDEINWVYPITLGVQVK